MDDTVMLYTNDNGEHHHSSKFRWPSVIIGNAGGALKADGRFVRFTDGEFWMNDLYCTLATACGVPTTTFGKENGATVKGIIPALLG